MISKKVKLLKKYDIEIGIVADATVFILIPTIGIMIVKEEFEVRFLLSFLFFNFIIVIDKYDYEYTKNKTKGEIKC